MLEVITVDPLAAEPVLSGDEHVPLMAEWGLVPAVVWQAVWPDGRVCCEMTVARIGGRISGVTLLNAPLVGLAAESRAADSDEEEGIPVVSLSPFDPNPDLDPQRSLVKAPCSPTAVVAGEWLEVRFDEVIPIRWAMTGSFGFGIDQTGRLVGIRVRAAEVPSVSALAIDR